MNAGGVAAGAAPGSTEFSAQDNAAWAKANIALSTENGWIFLADVERLFRLNPHLDITDWREEAGPSHSCKLSALNESNGCRYETTMKIEQVPCNRCLTIKYDKGLKAATEFRIESSQTGSSLTITERYRPLRDWDDGRLNEVDRSLVPWLAAIRGHIAGLARYRWLPGYHWWTGHFMLGMPPRQRRMVNMVIWVSLLEFVIFLFVAAIFWLEQQRG